jgi:hypothetical protein
MTDIGNSLLHNPFWEHDSLYDSISNMIDFPLPLPDETPFHTVKDLSVDIPENPLSYIDDTIGVTPDIDDNALRMSRVIPLAIMTLAGPLLDQYDVKRYHLFNEI